MHWVKPLAKLGLKSGWGAAKLSFRGAKAVGKVPISLAKTPVGRGVLLGGIGLTAATVGAKRMLAPPPARGLSQEMAAPKARSKKWRSLM